MPSLSHAKLYGALRRVESTLRAGERQYPNDRWRQQSVRVHLWRCARHLVLWRLGNKSEDHLGHAATRFLMAIELLISRGQR